MSEKSDSRKGEGFIIKSDGTVDDGMFHDRYMGLDQESEAFLEAYYREHGVAIRKANTEDIKPVDGEGSHDEKGTAA